MRCFIYTASIDPLVVGFDQEGAEARLKDRQGEHGRGGRCFQWGIPRLLTQEELIDRFKEAFDFAATARYRNN